MYYLNASSVDIQVKEEDTSKLMNTSSKLRHTFLISDYIHKMSRVNSAIYLKVCNNGGRLSVGPSYL